MIGKLLTIPPLVPKARSSRQWGRLGAGGTVGRFRSGKEQTDRYKWFEKLSEHFLFESNSIQTVRAGFCVITRGVCDVAVYLEGGNFCLTVNTRQNLCFSSVFILFRPNFIYLKFWDPIIFNQHSDFVYVLMYTGVKITWKC